jgi:hypothetical protein
MRRCSNVKIHVLLAALIAPALATEVRADILQVAYINAQGGYVDYLSNSGINVTYFNDTTSNPLHLTLAQLAPYNAILISGNGAFTDPTNIGNVAAAFADSGRGVVLTAFAYFTVGGNIMTPSYSPLNLISTNDFIASETLGTVFDASSPIFAGVNTSAVSDEYDVDLGVNPGATLVASWTTNQNLAPFGTTRPAAAIMPLANSAVVALNLFPGTGYVQNAISADAETMIADSLKFSAATPNPPTVPEPSTLILAGICASCARKLLRVATVREQDSRPLPDGRGS